MDTPCISSKKDRYRAFSFLDTASNIFVPSRNSFANFERSKKEKKEMTTRLSVERFRLLLIQAKLYHNSTDYFRYLNQANANARTRQGVRP